MFFEEFKYDGVVFIQEEDVGCEVFLRARFKCYSEQS